MVHLYIRVSTFPFRSEALIAAMLEEIEEFFNKILILEEIALIVG